MEPLIRCENLVKIYSLDGVEIVALQGLDLFVEEGEIVGIVGTSGSGKTTLLNILGGLIQPSAGKVLVSGKDLGQMSEHQLDRYRCREVGFLWQQTGRNLIPYLTALENVELPMRLMNRTNPKSHQHAMQLLDILGLYSRLKHMPVQLSGGEQQRVAIAIALANQPRILLADEPTGEVDTACAAQIYAALRKINDLYGMTILIVSHDPNLSHFTDRVVAIRDGKTSTETVRSEQQKTPKDARLITQDLKLGSAEGYPQLFEEYVVLDKAGRLQIPSDYLELLNIGDRVKLELQDDHLAIHPVADHRYAATSDLESSAQSQELYLPPDQAPKSAGNIWIKRIRSLPERLNFFHRSNTGGISK